MDEWIDIRRAEEEEDIGGDGDITKEMDVEAEMERRGGLESTPEGTRETRPTVFPELKEKKKGPYDVLEELRDYKKKRPYGF